MAQSEGRFGRAIQMTADNVIATMQREHPNTVPASNLDAFAAMRKIQLDENKALRALLMKGLPPAKYEEAKAQIEAATNARIKNEVHGEEVKSSFTLNFHTAMEKLGSESPDGDQWPIPYLAPFSAAPRLVWSGQWALNAWPNILITAVLIALALRWAWQRGYSPLEMVSTRADAVFVATLRRRFPAGEGK